MTAQPLKGGESHGSRRMPIGSDFAMTEIPAETTTINNIVFDRESLPPYE